MHTPPFLLLCFLAFAIPTHAQPHPPAKETNALVVRHLVKKCALTGADFTEWYYDGAPVVDGWIQPGEVAIDADNWTGWGWHIPPRGKWTYTAEDAEGNEHHAETEIKLIAAIPVNLNGKIVYQEYFKFHAGDDTAWAQPEFDDSAWAQIEFGAFPQDWQGIGWFRDVVEVDSTLWNEPFQAIIDYMVAAGEKWANGRPQDDDVTFVVVKMK